MKNEKLIYSIGNIADKYIIEAQPKTSKGVTMFRKSVIMAAAIAAFLLLCAFTVYVIVVGDLWFQKPSNDPIETVRSAIENQIEKEYGLKVEVNSIEIDEAETARVIERFISGVLADRRGWSDEYLAEHFIVVKAVYYAEYDHTKTSRADGNIVQFFYLTRDVQSGKWTIVDNSGNVNWSDDLIGDDEADTGTGEDPSLENNAVVISTQEQIMSYLSEMFTKAYAPYYDGLHYEMTNYEETILDTECTATFFWRMYYLGKGWDVGSDEGVEQQVNFQLQATVTIINDGELDLSTISVLSNDSPVGVDYSTPVEEHFPDQFSD